MALVRGKFVDKTEPIKSLIDPVAGEDLARKSYADSVAAAEAAAAVAGKIEDAIVNGVVDKAPSQNAVFDALALKQASLGTGTTSQYLRGDLTWQEISTSYPVAQMKYVAKHGVDETADGSQEKPYLTISAALASITDATPTKRYVVRIAAGNYTEASLAIKANVFLIGENKESVRITGAVSMASDFNQPAANDCRSGASMLSFFSAADFNWQTVTSPAGKLYFNEVVFANTLSLYGHNNAIAQAHFDSCVVFGAMTVSGINVAVYNNCVNFSNVTLNQHPGGGMATILNASGGHCGGTVTLTAATNDFNRRCSLFAKNYYMEYVTVDGPSAYADMNDGSLPRSRDRISSLNGGNIVYITAKAPHVTDSMSIGEVGYQYLFNFAYVHASTNTDLYLISMGNSYSAASVGRSVFVESDSYGLNADVNGGDINLTTATTSGTGVRGKINLSARLVDGNSSKIVNLGAPSDDNDAATKKYVDDSVAAVVGSVESVNGETGAVVLDTDDIAESATPTNKWFTDARAKAAVVDNSISDGVTDKAPSQNAVFDALALKLDQSARGVANGVASLGADGKIPNTQVPAIAISDTFVVASEAAMLALSSAEKGDVAVRTDLSKSFILAGTDPAVLADWQELLSPTDAVQSVNGQTGTVTLDSDDIAEGATNKYFSDSLAKAAAVSNSITDGVIDVAPSQDAVHNALALKSDVGHTHVAADITDFAAEAKSAAVVNSTAGTETDQAASVAALKSYVSGQISAIVMPVGKKERFVLVAQDITNGYVDCSFQALADTMLLMTGGVIHNEGSGEDYTLSVVSGKTRITFQPDLAAMLVAGDDIYVQYLK